MCTDGGSRAGKVVPYKPLLDRALGLCKTRRPPWWCSTVGWRPSSRWRGATWTTPRCAPGIRARGCRWPGWSRPNPAISCTRQARPASPGRAARHRRLCRGAGFFHGVPVQRQAGRHVLLHQRHRLGGGALVHHLWPADRRAGHHPVRRHAGAAGRRHPVEAGGKVPGQHAVLGADRGARAQAPGSGPAEKARPVLAARRIPGRRTAGRAHRAMDLPGAGQAHHRQLLADRIGLADPVGPARRGKRADAFRQSLVPGVWL